MFDEDQADERRQRKLRQPDMRQRRRDLARKSLAPEVAFERVGNLDLVDAVNENVPDARPSGEFSVFRSQRPESEAMLVPMRMLVAR